MTKKETKRDRVIAIIVFVVILGMLSVLIAFSQISAFNSKRAHYQTIAESQTAVMLDSIDRVVASANTLEALVVSNDGSTDFFDEAAPRLCDTVVQNSGITVRNVALAPGGVVEKVYPLDGNMSLLGFDFFDTQKTGNEAAIKAYETHSMIISDPFSLVQGGTGISSRLPVYLQGTNDSETFWGFVSVTTDFDNLLTSMHLDSLESEAVNYRLWYSDVQGNEVTLAQSAALPVDAVSAPLETRGLNWHLDVAPSEGWVSVSNLVMECIIALAFAILIAVLVYQARGMRRANEVLRRLANLDSLTLCHSRHYVNTILINHQTGEWNDPATKYSLIIVDVDRFKSINDTYGHDVGDEALTAISSVLRENIASEDGDCVIRHGGDEFVIVYNDVTRERFSNKLKAISDGVRAIRLQKNPDIHLTVSLGGEYYDDAEDKRYHAMLNAADQKLYDAKENGRDLIVF